MFLRHEAQQPVDFDGLRIVDYTAHQNGSSSLAEITVPAGVRHARAWSRRSDKYYYVINGTISFTIDEETFDARSGDVCIIRQGQRFSYHNNGRNDAKLILIHTPTFDLDAEVFESQ